MLIVTRRTFLIPVACLVLAAMISAQPALGDEKKLVNTTVTVGEMCGGCVKQITARFDKEKSVAKIKCDIDTKSVEIFPAKDVRLSPLGIWEILESIGKKPSKLVGPEGTFTSKPKKT